MIDYLATILSCMGALLISGNTNKVRFLGYGIWVVSNGLFIYYGYITMQVSLIILFTFYQFCNARGLFYNRNWEGK